MADVFENFRKTCLSYYRLDPANYLSAPGLAWDAMLLKTDIQLDLVNDLETLDFIERSKRGAKANNIYLDDYDSAKESTYKTYFDANNLYGWAMVQLLPFFYYWFK